MFHHRGKLWAHDIKDSSSSEENKLLDYVSKVNPYPSVMVELLTSCYYCAASFPVNCVRTGDGCASPPTTEGHATNALLLARCREVIKCYRAYETSSGGIQGLMDTCGDIWLSIENTQLESDTTQHVTSEKKAVTSPVSLQSVTSSSSVVNTTKANGKIPSSESLAAQDIGLTLLSTLLYALVEESFLCGVNEETNPQRDAKVAEEVFHFVSSSNIDTPIYFSSVPFGSQLKIAVSKCAMVRCCSLCDKLGDSKEKSTLMDTVRSLIKCIELELLEVTSQKGVALSVNHQSEGRVSYDNSALSNFITTVLPLLRKSCIKLVLWENSKCGDSVSVEESKMILRAVILNEWIPALYKVLYPRSSGSVASTTTSPPVFCQPIMYAPLLAGIVQLIEIGDILSCGREEMTANVNNNDEVYNGINWNFGSRIRKAIFHHLLSKNDVYNKSEISTLSDDKNDRKRVIFGLSRGLVQAVSPMILGSDKGNNSVSNGKITSNSTPFIDAVRKGLGSINIIVKRPVPSYVCNEDSFKKAFHNCCPSTFFDTDKCEPQKSNTPGEGVVAVSMKSVTPSVSKMSSNTTPTESLPQEDMLFPVELVYTLLVTNPIEAWMCIFDATAMDPVSPSTTYDGRDVNISYETLVSDGETQSSARFKELYAGLSSKEDSSENTSVSLMHHLTNVMRSFTHRLVFYFNAIERLVNHVFQSSGSVMSMNPFSCSSSLMNSTTTTSSIAPSTSNIISKYIMLYIVSCMDAAILLLGKYRVSGPYVLMCLGMESNLRRILRDDFLTTTATDDSSHTKEGAISSTHSACVLACMWESVNTSFSAIDNETVTILSKLDTNAATRKPTSVWTTIFDWVKRAILNRNEFGYCLVFIPLFKAMGCGAGGCGSHLDSICYPCVLSSSVDVPGGYDSCQRALISLLSIPERSKLISTVRHLIEAPFPYFLAFSTDDVFSSETLGTGATGIINVLPRESVRFIEHYELSNIVAQCAAEAAVFVSCYKTKSLTTSDRPYYSPAIIDIAATFFYSFVSLMRMKDVPQSLEGTSLFSKSGVFGKLQCFHRLMSAVEGLLGEGNTVPYMETPSLSARTSTAATRLTNTSLADSFIFWPLLAATEKELLVEIAEEKGSSSPQSQVDDMYSMAIHTPSPLIVRNLVRYISIPAPYITPANVKSRSREDQQSPNRLPICTPNTCTSIITLGACDVVPIRPFDQFKSIASFQGESFSHMLAPTEKDAVISNCEPLWNILQEKQNSNVERLLRTNSGNSETFTLESLCIDVLSHIAHMPCPTTLLSEISSIKQLLEDHDYRFKALVSFFKMLLIKASISVSDAEAAAHVVKALVSVKEIPPKKVGSESFSSASLAVIPINKEVKNGEESECLTTVKRECSKIKVLDSAEKSELLNVGHMLSTGETKEEHKVGNICSVGDLSSENDKKVVNNNDNKIESESHEDVQNTLKSVSNTTPQENDSSKNAQLPESLPPLLPLSYVMFKAVSQVLVDGCISYVTLSTKHEAASLCHFTKVLCEEVIIPWCTQTAVSPESDSKNRSVAAGSASPSASLSFPDNVRSCIISDSKFPMLPKHGTDTSDKIMFNIIVENAKLYESCLSSSTAPSCSLWVSLSIKSSLRNILGWVYRQRKHCKWAEEHPFLKSDAVFLAQTKAVNFTNVSTALGLSGATKESVESLSELWPKHTSQLEKVEDLLIQQIQINSKGTSTSDHARGRSTTRRSSGISSSHGNAIQTSDKYANKIIPSSSSRNTINSTSQGANRNTSYASTIGSRRERSRSPLDRNRSKYSSNNQKRDRSISPNERKETVSRSHSQTALQRPDGVKRRGEYDNKKTVPPYPTTIQPPSYQKGTHSIKAPSSQTEYRDGYSKEDHKKVDPNDTDEMLKKRAARFNSVN